MSFENIIGHDDIKNQIKNSIDSDKFSHAHLIFGEDGIGKSIIANEVALKLLNKDIDREYVDIIKWKIGKNKKSIGVNDVRDIIKEVNKKPYEEDKKIIIVYEAHKMTQEAQNAFLKTIEEPPKGVVIILLSDNLELILDTIKSRCQIHKLKRLNIDEIKLYIFREYPDLNEQQIKQVVSFSEGIPGRCKFFLEGKLFKELRECVVKILISLNNKDKSIIDKWEKFIFTYREEWIEIINLFISYLRDIIVYKDMGENHFIINNDKLEYIQKLSNIYSFKQLYKMINVINNTREKLERKVNLQLAFGMMLLRLQEV